MAEKLTSLAKRLRPFILGQMIAVSNSGGLGPGEGPGIDIVTNVVGFGGDTILLYNSGGVPVAEYAATAAGLTDALAAMASGEQVVIDCVISITGNFIIPAGGKLKSHTRTMATIIGQITQENGSEIHELKIANAADSADDIYGVIGPSSGISYIYNSDISAIQSGAGNAYAIGATRGLTTNNGDIVVRHSKLYGSSVSGSGYAGRSLRGRIYARHNDYYGSTARWVQS